MELKLTWLCSRKEKISSTLDSEVLLFAFFWVNADVCTASSGECEECVGRKILKVLANGGKRIGRRTEMNEKVIRKWKE